MNMLRHPIPSSQKLPLSSWSRSWTSVDVPQLTAKKVKDGCTLESQGLLFTYMRPQKMSVGYGVWHTRTCIVIFWFEVCSMICGRCPLGGACMRQHFHQTVPSALSVPDSHILQSCDFRCTALSITEHFRGSRFWMPV